ncbi:hypothetical protein [Haloarchaeobius sp. DFWS5]|uniref:hypothetical protein n=1 Tax=Haloarchaeobius sp. DFWS5 TaxID=3446114 RepID=UPI003EBD895B
MPATFLTFRQQLVVRLLGFVLLLVYGFLTGGGLWFALAATASVYLEIRRPGLTRFARAERRHR